MTSQARLVGGRYEEGESLGRGGMADVRKGVDNRLGRTVAIKRLRVDLASDSTFQARFRREAQSAASLNHPSIVAVYDTGEEPDPNGSGITIPYIVMEYVAGKTLRDMLREGRKIMPERALEITAGVLEALDYSHRAGIVHRDIKPGNVMLNPYGAVKVMDFGIARAVADTSATMTQTAAVIGTAQYLSPEQARGETVDARSDLYSTGCLLYELLTGRPPFVGESPVSVAYQHVREQPSPPSSYDPDIPPEVDAVVLKALAKNREERYQSASDMRADIHRILAGQQVTAPMAAVAETRPMYGAAAAGGTVIEDPERDHVVGFGDDDENGQNGNRKTRGFAYFLLGLAIVAVAVGGYLLWDNLSGPSKPTTIEVPSLVGKSRAQAITALSAAGLQVGTQQERSSNDFEPGQVMDQDPKALTQAEPGTKVNLVISAGEPKVQVPNVKGKSNTEARALLEKAKFGYKEESRNSPEKAGTVVDYSPSGAQPVGTEITVFIANGKVRLPNVVDLPEDQARNALQEAGLTLVASVDTTSNKPPGVVARMEPPGGDDKWVEKGTKITLYISKQDEPPPTQPTEPTETPSETPDTPPGITITPPGGGEGGEGQSGD
jgi:eukaryotic-like serine/threonine-protein kinase